MTWARPIILFCFAATMFAHPMGNFSVSHYTRIAPGAGGVAVVYVLDLAEIPTFELLRDWNLEATSPTPALQAHAEAQAKEWMNGLRFTVNDRAITPRFDKAQLSVADGAAGLKVFRITTHLRLPAAIGRLEFEDRNFEGRAGWKEIVIDAQNGAAITRSSHSAEDRSRALTAYPGDLSAPPQDLRASVEWTSAPSAAVRPVPVIAPVPQPAPPAARAEPPPSSTAAAPQPAGTVVKGDFLSTLLSTRDLSLWMILTGLAAAFVLGAAHAFTPGHGKTMVAAYLVGSRGTARHAVLLGAMVTFTHTISVFALGLVTLFLAQYVVPEKLIKVLELISGVSIVLIGGSLLYKRIRAMRAHSHHHDHHDHDHGHDHDHDHGHGHGHDHDHDHGHHHHDHDHHHGHDHDHDHAHHHHHGPGGHSHAIEGEVTMASLIALGASGGLVPCPSALVLMLSAIAVGRVGFGMLLLILFSVGLAIVLTGIGVAVVYAKHLIPDSQKAAAHPVFRFIPVMSAAVIVCIGLLMTGVALGWISPNLAV